MWIFMMKAIIVSLIWLQSKDYLPPRLWPDFSILATIKPETMEGGFLFAVVDYLEAGIQFGLGLSKGLNEYTQHIDLWYSEDAMEKVRVHAWLSNTMKS